MIESKENKKVNNRKWEPFKAAFLKFYCQTVDQGTNFSQVDNT